MNRLSRKKIKALYRAPISNRKDEILRSFPHTRTLSDFEILKTQLPYIRKRVWLLTLLIFVAAAYLTRELSAEAVRLVAALMPFAAAFAVLETMRSTAYRMDELECSTRFSLTHLILTRLTVLGVTHLGLLSGCALLLKRTRAFSFLSAVPYLLVPYLLTAILGMLLARRFRQSGEVTLLLAAVVGTVMGLTPEIFPQIYARDFVGIWTAVAIALLALTTALFHRQFQHTEDFSWSFSSIE